MTQVRYAVVGLQHGMGHVEVAMHNERVALAALCDVDADKLAASRECVARQGVEAQTFTSYEAMLDWGAFDVVILAVPPPLHGDYTLAALRGGKHVLVEKPLTTTLPAAEALLAAAREYAGIVQVGYCVRSSQLVQQARQLIAGGHLGEVVMVWWHMFLDEHSHQGAWYNDRRQGGGKLFDCGCHYIDIMALLAGAPVTRVAAFGAPLGVTGANADALADVATVIFEYANGAKGNFSLSTVSPTPESSLFGIVGTRGIIYGNPWRPEGAGSLDCYTDGGLYHQQITINGEMASRGHLGFAEQHDAFLDAILHGAPTPCSLEDACEISRLMDAVDRALASGETVGREAVSSAQ